MTTQTPSFALLPLNSEQLVRLQVVTTDFTPTQLMWASGYLWGMLNQQPGSNAVASALVAEMPGIMLTSASQTGNARRIAETLHDDLIAAKFSIILTNAGDYKLKQIANEKLLIMVAST